MTTIDKLKAGEFSWMELATTDVAGAKSFYTKLFGWGTQDQPIPDGGTYTMFTVGDRPAAAATPQQDQERSQGVPPHWNLYVIVDDVDKSAARAGEGGGTVLAPPFDVMEMGRMAVISDPSGAIISLWQAKQMQGIAVKDEPGAFRWAEVYAPDTERATKFYEELFGWHANTVQMDQGPYTILHNEGHDVAGLMASPNPDVPPMWMIYFQVSDADAAAKTVADTGGQVQMEPMDIPDVGPFAVFSDPQGAVFGVLQPKS